MLQSSFWPYQPEDLPQKRNVKKVPFVELFNDRVQGVVSSGSDINRVYVAFIEAGTGDFYCSTNNNRPCGGLGGRPCSHIQEMLEEAMAQYGTARVGRFLKIPIDVSQVTAAWGLIQHLNGSQKKEPANEVFSRFLTYLRYVELPTSKHPIPEMTWFVS
ncbi:hypothetical protein U14_02386 [Candidatus Moduliflexus flocculans]|uniref:Uncharacterized protein n=1 Tax=Candidatus Moduliflexus flocculans TaxID=1499966 RepID=A0A081BL78_9BACT|nr:hypothetical protein U14_02386 [Candidatus Moduliflexus flocculans]